MIFAQYLKFLINGGLLGLAAWVLQAGLFRLLGQTNSSSYAIASVLTYLPFILLNFAIQRRLIFTAPGGLSRFIVANTCIMIVVSSLSPLCRELVAEIGGGSAGDQGGFILAALIGATPSFLLSRFFVFRHQPVGTES
jgi:putative flippase GtrA